MVHWRGRSGEVAADVLQASQGQYNRLGTATSRHVDGDVFSSELCRTSLWLHLHAADQYGRGVEFAVDDREHYSQQYCKGSPQ